MTYLTVVSILGLILACICWAMNARLDSIQRKRTEKLKQSEDAYKKLIDLQAMKSDAINDICEITIKIEEL